MGWKKTKKTNAQKTGITYEYGRQAAGTMEEPLWCYCVNTALPTCIESIVSLNAPRIRPDATSQLLKPTDFGFVLLFGSLNIYLVYFKSTKTDRTIFSLFNTRITSKSHFLGFLFTALFFSSFSACSTWSITPMEDWSQYVCTCFFGSVSLVNTHPTQPANVRLHPAPAVLMLSWCYRDQVTWLLRPPNWPWVSTTLVCSNNWISHDTLYDTCKKKNYW